MVNALSYTGGLQAQVINDSFVDPCAGLWHTSSGQITVILKNVSFLSVSKNRTLTLKEFKAYRTTVLVSSSQPKLKIR